MLPSSSKAGILSGFMFIRWLVILFVNNSFPSSLNQSLLVLIPEVEHPQNVKEFKPIFLCNVLYKIIFKVIVNRIKHLLSDIINHTQASFVPNRHTSDNIFMVQELIQHLCKTKAKDGGMAMKLDLEKAND